MTPRKILLSTDFSECSESAFAAAVDIARRSEARKEGAEIDLVHVVGALPAFAFGHSGASLSIDELHVQARERLEEIRSRPLFARLRVNTHAIDGRGAEALTEFAKSGGHDLVVISTHGHTGLSRLFLGSFAEQAVRLFECPVLTVRPGVAGTKAGFHPRRILWPIDFSEHSLSTLGTVRDLASEFDAEVLTAFVVSPEVYAPSVYTPGFSVAEATPLWEDARDRARKDLAARVEKDLAGVKAKSAVWVGAPVAEIVARAEKEQIDLIVLSTHGHTGIKHALLGSVAERIVRLAPCSVWTIHPKS